MTQQSKDSRRAHFAKANRNKQNRDLQRNEVLDQMSADLAHSITTTAAGSGIIVVGTQAEADRVNQRTRQEMLSRGSLRGHVVDIVGLEKFSPNDQCRDYQFRPDEYIHFRETVGGFNENEMVQALDYRRRSEPTMSMMVQCNDGSRKSLPPLKADQYHHYKSYHLPVARGEQLRVTRRSLISEIEGAHQAFTIQYIELDAPVPDHDPAFEWHYNNLYGFEKNQICQVQYLGHCKAALHLDKGEKVPSDFNSLKYGYAVTPEQLPSHKISFLYAHGDKLFRDTRVKEYLEKLPTHVHVYNEFGLACDKYGNKKKDYFLDRYPGLYPEFNSEKSKSQDKDKEIDMEM